MTKNDENDENDEKWWKWRNVMEKWRKMTKRDENEEKFWWKWRKMMKMTRNVENDEKWWKWREMLKMQTLNVDHISLSKPAVKNNLKEQHRTESCKSQCLSHLATRTHKPRTLTHTQPETHRSTTENTHTQAQTGTEKHTDRQKHNSTKTKITKNRNQEKTLSCFSFFSFIFRFDEVGGVWPKVGPIHLDISISSEKIQIFRARTELQYLRWSPATGRREQDEMTARLVARGAKKRVFNGIPHGDVVRKCADKCPVRRILGCSLRNAGNSLSKKNSHFVAARRIELRAVWSFRLFRNVVGYFFKSCPNIPNIPNIHHWRPWGHCEKRQRGTAREKQTRGEMGGGRVRGRRGLKGEFNRGGWTGREERERRGEQREWTGRGGGRGLKKTEVKKGCPKRRSKRRGKKGVKKEYKVIQREK